MRKIGILSFICLFLTPQLTFPAETIYVGPTRTHTTIQAGIDVAADGDTVIVDPGTYTGPGNRDIDFLGKAITVKSETGPENCIIDCQATIMELHRGFRFHNGEQQDSVLDGLTITNGYAPKELLETEPFGTILEFSIGGAIFCDGSSPTVTRCRLLNNSAEVGGGISCYNSNATITNCTIRHNWASSQGGGISAANCIISNCLISDNSSGYSGGGFSGTNCTLIACIVTNNSVPDGFGGGGISCYGTFMITNCTIRNNTVTGIMGSTDLGRDGGPGGDARGGGIYLFSTPNDEITIRNCILSDNTATGGEGGGPGCLGCNVGVGGNGYGGAIYCDYYGNYKIENCIFLANTAAYNLVYGGDSYGGSICSNSSEGTTIRHCIFSDGIADNGSEVAAIKYPSGPSHMTVSYCNIAGLQTSAYADEGCTLNWGLGNIDVEPVLTPDGHLHEDSPCRNAGDPDYISGPEKTDVDGEQYATDGRADIGIDEFIDTDSDGLPDWWELKYFGNPTIAETTGNPDGDYYNNLEEYYMSSDPLALPIPYYVNPLSGNDTWDGLSSVWDGTHGPKATIQAAIDIAGYGEFIMLADGTYTGDGNRDLDFKAKAITVKSENGPENCIIDCQGTKDDRHRGFYFHNGEDTKNVLDGVTITNGFPPPEQGEDEYGSFEQGIGGAILCTDSSPTIKNCIIKNNIGDYAGGGIYCLRSDPNIIDSVIIENSSFWSGGGIACSKSNADIINCSITGNTTDLGAGIYCWEGNPNIIGCVISDNSPFYGSGGGVYCSHSDPNIINSNITNNTAGGLYCIVSKPYISDCNISDNSGEGGGIFCFGNSSSIIANCTIEDNSSLYEGGGIYCENDINTTIISCSISKNKAKYSGGGIYARDSSLAIENCTISENKYTISGRGGTGLGYGGGISIIDGIYLVNNCKIINNSAQMSGGAIQCSGGDNTTIKNCLITGNYTLSSAGGIFFDDTNTIIDNCTFASNSSGYGNAMACDSYKHSRPSNLQITNCILWNGGGEIYNRDNSTITIKHSDVQGGWQGQGNIDIEPGFAFHGDYHLIPPSPCINAGDPNYTPEPDDTDLDGNARIITERIDMGAYEYNPHTPSIAVSSNKLSFFMDWPKPEPQTLFIRNCGGGNLNWQIVKDCNWLQVSPTSGTSSGQVNEVTISVDPNALALGPYTCALTVFDTNAVNSPITIQVKFNVGAILRVPGQFDTIQAAVDAANDYDLVLVADDIYTGQGNYDIDFHPKNIIIRSENGPENCIIDCQNLGSGFLSPDDYILRNIYGDIAVIDGFTIINGYAGRGNGIYCANYYSLTINNCIIRNNLRSGIFCSAQSIGKTLTISNCSISNNSVSGIYINDYREAIIANCTITGNSTTSVGGGIRCEITSPTITNCKITDNTAETDGGGVFCVTWGGEKVLNPNITNCLISGNTAGRMGGAVLYSCGTGSRPKINNCTVVSNKAGLHSGGIAHYLGTLMLNNSILWDNTAPDGPQLGILGTSSYHSTLSATYNDIQGGEGQVYTNEDSILIWDTSNIDADPFFNDPGFWDTNDTPADANDDIWVEGDYYLLPASPCIDTGDPCYIPEPNETDLDGNPRVINGRIDMGAYETNYLQVPMKFTPQALNLTSGGKLLKAHFVLPEGFSVEDVDADTPAVIELFGVQSYKIKVLLDDDRLVRVEATFNRSDLCRSITSYDHNIEVMVIGYLTTGQQFYGTDIIKVTNRAFDHLAILVSHWLEADCSQPHWCDGADLNEDSIVNFIDFALLAPCCIEVIK